MRFYVQPKGALIRCCILGGSPVQPFKRQALNGPQGLVMPCGQVKVLV